MQEEPKRRHWQFSLRDVLLIMAIVALAVGWYVDHYRLADELARRQLNQNWVWLDNTTANRPGAYLDSLKLLNFTTVPAPTAADEPNTSDETITNPPPATENP